MESRNQPPESVEIVWTGKFPSVKATGGVAYYLITVLGMLAIVGAIVVAIRGS